MVVTASVPRPMGTDVAPEDEDEEPFDSLPHLRVAAASLGMALSEPDVSRLRHAFSAGSRAMADMHGRELISEIRRFEKEWIETFERLQAAVDDASGRDRERRAG